MKTPAQTCGPMGEAHSYLGHFKQAQHLNRGHNTTETIPAKGGKPEITFKKGGEHASLGVPAGEKIPAAKKAAARSGKYGAKAEKQELFRENVLKGRG
jgi:hypothetical protein